MITEHLGTNDEIIEYTTDMITQLNYHRDEKLGLRPMNRLDAMNIVIPEISKRISNIEMLNNQLKIDMQLKQNHERMLKQFIHIGNYSLFGYLKSKEALQKFRNVSRK